MKKIKTEAITADNLDLSSWEDNSLVQWTSQNGKSLAIGLCVLAALIVVLLRFTSGGKAKAENDYINAANSYTILQSEPKEDADPAAQKEALDSLQTIVARRPELQSKYDGFLAEYLLVKNDPDAAQPYAARALDRTSGDKLRHYQAFARNTLLIANKQTEKAIENALRLKEDLSKETASPDSLVYAFNLVRIAMLYKELGNKDLEIQAWKELKEYASKDLPASRILNRQFQEGKISLSDYIELQIKNS